MKRSQPVLGVVLSSNGDLFIPKEQEIGRYGLWMAFMSKVGQIAEVY